MNEILEHLKEYLQSLIDSGQHKIYYNDLMHDEKVINCINAINEQQEEIERLNNIINELEKYIISQMQEQETLKETKAPTYIFCKLQELKGVDKE